MNKFSNILIIGKLMIKEVNFNMKCNISFFYTSGKTVD